MKPSFKFGSISSITGVIGAALLLFSACSSAGETKALALLGYNHTGSEIASYEVTVGTKKREGGYIGPGQGGGSSICCVIVPKHWTQGMTANVSILRYDGKNFNTTNHRVDVPKYDGERDTSFSVHFLHDGRIKVFVSQYHLGHRDYPLKGKDAEMRPGESIEIIN